jgi:hypothetical protein
MSAATIIALAPARIAKERNPTSDQPNSTRVLHNATGDDRRSDVSRIRSERQARRRSSTHPKRLLPDSELLHFAARSRLTCTWAPTECEEFLDPNHCPATP